MSTEIMEREKVNHLLLQTDEYVRHEYLSVLDHATPLPLNPDFKRAVGLNMQIMHLESFTYNSNDDMSQKIRSVYGAVKRTGNTAALILDGRKDCVDLYLGLFTRDVQKISSNYKAFLSSFHGVFPGCRYRNLKNQMGQKLLDDLMNAPVKTSIAAVSGFPLQQNSKNNTALPGLEVLVDGMRNRPFTMVLLAEAIDRAELVQMRQGYESLYTEIGPLQKQEISVSSSKTGTIGTNFSKSVADSLSISSGISRGHTDTFGTGHSTQTEPDHEGQKKYQAANQLAGAAIAAASVLTLGSGGLVVKEGANILQNLFYGQTFSNLLNSGAVITGHDGKADTKPETDSSHEDHSDTVTTQENETSGRTVTESETESTSLGLTEGRTTQLSYINKSVSGLLERIEEQIQEFMRLESEGAYRTAAYFIAGDEETAISAASLYRSIVTAKTAALVNSPVYHWSEESKCKEILSSLQRGIHPSFSFEQYPEFPYISAAQPIGLSDLPYYLCLPKKSIFGLNVAEHAAFSRDILSREYQIDQWEKSVSVGCIYHMGQEIKTTPVSLNLDTLASHLFVAGATGVGKSNFCYQFIDCLLENQIKILVIEPAKGEYAKVFGGRDDFKVYGTNLRQAPPLRINPFAFPAGVSASEHIERLLAIFSAAWPMYSAMPAIMKEALEEIYRRRGFDDIWGDLPENGAFPTFSDLLCVLPEIIKRSDYSAEVQGNYTGALVTRVKSLTNGVYHIIFSDDEIGDAGLFDENVIIDLSRIGSEETKALIMGFLVTRLSEYRSCSGLMNSGLKHITLLEEAHHLLGKVSGVQSQDVGNMQGASVQMLSNAVREMRTYGEGFIIADQSPSVMDPSVVANTQTKVFFMMPRREDRAIAGDAMSLDEGQRDEIAKLPKGVAAVLQNEWTSAVLCKINHFKPEKQKAFSYLASPEKEAKEILTAAIRILLKNRYSYKQKDLVLSDAVDKGNLENMGYGLGQKRGLVFHILRNKEKYENLRANELSEYFQRLLDLENLFRRNTKEEDIRCWAGAIEEEIMGKTTLCREETEAMIHVYLLAKSKENSNYHRLYVAYLILKNDTK